MLIVLVIIVALAGTIYSIGDFTGLWAPAPGDEDTSLISASDIIKNFQLTSFDGESIINNRVDDNKLKFQTQDEWLINEKTLQISDIQYVQVAGGGFDVYFRYNIEARTRINIYTSYLVNQVTEKFNKYNESFPSGHYKHWTLRGWGDTLLYEWDRDITWEHYEFGESIITYGARELVYDGMLEMTFEIADDPFPLDFGTASESKWAYIVVQSAANVYSEVGDMSDVGLPTYLPLSPSEYDSDETVEYSQTSGPVEGAFEARFDPGIELSKEAIFNEQFAEGIIPMVPAGGLNPKNLDGSNTWDRETQNKSMTGCRLQYDVSSLSPKVATWIARLEYNEIWLETEEYLAISDLTYKIRERYFQRDEYDIYRDAMLQVTNRYIQPEIRVIFDIWSKVEIGPLTVYYELLKLERPQEFNEELIWSTIVGGWKGSYVRVTPTPLSGEDIIKFIIILAAIIIGIYLFVQVGIPLIMKRQATKVITGR